MSYHREAAYKANMIEIQKAEPSKKEEYKKIFANSSLYNHYFKKGSLLDECVDSAVDNGEAYIAVDRNGEAVGYMSMKAADAFVDNLPNITLLGVKENFRGRGIGQELIGFYIEVMKELGFEEAAIVVNDWNPRARKLYDSLGFKLRKTADDPFGYDWQDFILVKKL